jgi:disulfide bond formation protein DsbB
MSGIAFYRLIAILSLVSLIASFTAEFAFGLTPCYLCLAQRYSVAAILLFSLINSFYIRRLAAIATTVSLLCLALMSGVHLATLSGYLPAKCTRPNSPPTSLSQYKEQLSNQTDCIRDAWKPMGVPAPYFTLLLGLLGLGLQGVHWKFVPQWNRDANLRLENSTWQGDSI